ncbi:MAG: GNAT family N-acetyltransferase [Bacteroidia bacterium]|nr:GNAT family N-acetyltransferase [Bacteroidia bacterium]
MQPLIGTAEVLDSSQASRWNSLFELLPDDLKDINYTFAYHELFEKNGDGKIRLFVYQSGNSIFYYPFLLRPILNEVVSEGFHDIETVYGYTGPLCTTSNPEFIQEAMSAFRDYCTNEKVICEFIRFHPLIRNHIVDYSDTRLKLIPLRDYVYVDLTKSETDIWNGYSPQNRNKIRKAEKLEVKIDSMFSSERYNEFVRIYLDNMKLVHAAKMYLFSKPFFTALAELVQRNGIFIQAQKNNVLVGAAVFFGGKKIAHYFLASATSEGKNMAVSNLILHHGTQWAKKNGMEKLHLGGGVSQNANDPLLVFKSNFSALTEKFYIGKRIHNEDVYKTLVEDWDKRFQKESGKYQSILQRYRWTDEDLT